MGATLPFLFTCHATYTILCGGGGGGGGHGDSGEGEDMTVMWLAAVVGQAWRALIDLKHALYYVCGNQCVVYGVAISGSSCSPSILWLILLLPSLPPALFCLCPFPSILLSTV